MSLAHSLALLPPISLNHGGILHFIRSGTKLQGGKEGKYRLIIITERASGSCCRNGLWNRRTAGRLTGGASMTTMMSWKRKSNITYERGFVSMNNTNKWKRGGGQLSLHSVKSPKGGAAA